VPDELAELPDAELPEDELPEDEPAEDEDADSFAGALLSLEPDEPSLPDEAPSLPLAEPESDDPDDSAVADALADAPARESLR
jgi:hypothetical protein